LRNESFFNQTIYNEISGTFRTENEILGTFKVQIRVLGTFKQKNKFHNANSNNLNYENYFFLKKFPILEFAL
jgi:hypothetical protein